VDLVWSVSGWCRSAEGAVNYQDGLSTAGGIPQLNRSTGNRADEVNQAVQNTIQLTKQSRSKVPLSGSCSHIFGFSRQ